MHIKNELQIILAPDLQRKASIIYALNDNPSNSNIIETYLNKWTKRCLRVSRHKVFN